MDIEYSKYTKDSLTATIDLGDYSLEVSPSQVSAVSENGDTMVIADGSDEVTALCDALCTVLQAQSEVEAAMERVVGKSKAIPKDVMAKIARV